MENRPVWTNQKNRTVLQQIFIWLSKIFLCLTIKTRSYIVHTHIVFLLCNILPIQIKFFAQKFFPTPKYLLHLLEGKDEFLVFVWKKNYLFQPGLNAKILIKILIMVNRFSSFYSIFASIQTTFDFIFKEVFILFPTILSLLLKGLIPCASFFYSL